MKKLCDVSCYLLVLSVASSAFTTANAKGWDEKDFETIVGKGVVEKPAERQSTQATDKEVVRLMTELGLGGGKFVAYAGDDQDDSEVQSKKVAYESKRNSKYTQTNANLQFGNASDVLNKKALNQVNALVRTYQIAKNEIKQITIKGHTNSVGSDEINLELSKNRAESVRVALLERGVPSSLISAQGFGENEPLSGTNPSSPINRRVEYAVVKK